MTVADATFIADNAQENLVKLVLGFSEAEEIMGSHAGEHAWFKWHLPLQAYVKHFKNLKDVSW